MKNLQTPTANAVRIGKFEVDYGSTWPKITYTARYGAMVNGAFVSAYETPPGIVEGNEAQPAAATLATIEDQLLAFLSALGRIPPVA